MSRKKGQRVKWKWSLTALLAMSVVMSACSGNTGNAPTPEQPAAGGGNAPVPEAQEATVELSWLINDVVLPDSYGQKYVEDNFNVKLNIISVPRADYVQRQQIMLTTGEAPDVMIVMDPNELKKYADQGLLAEVPMELIEQYAPRTKEAFDEHAPQGWLYTEHEGKNYGLPTFYGGKTTTPVAWRTDLLEKAGVTEVPETIDEMTEAFEALKSIGVYGMSSNGNSDFNLFQKIFGAHGVMPIQWMVKDGQVVNGAVQPEAKEALTLLADWYSKGYIDPEFVTGKDLDPKFVDGVYAFNENANVNTTDESNPNSSLSALKVINPEGEIEFGPLPKGPRGEYGGWSWGTAANSFAFGVQLQDQPDKMQRALEIMESAINDEEVFVNLAYGVQGTHWDFKNETDLTEGVKFLPPYDDMVKLREQGIKGGESFFAGRSSFDLFYKYYGDRLRQINEQYANNPVADIFGKPDILPSAGQYWGDLKKLKTEVYAKIIRGDEPVDYFDSFVQQWNDMGGVQLQEEAQALYESMN